jgi:chromosome partitioning protein
VKHPDDLASNLTDLADTPLARELVENSQRLEQAGSKVVDKPLTTRIITISNQKGGVGKTTTTVNLASALASKGLKILVVDLDPQGNASTALGIDHHADIKSIYEVLIDDVPIAQVVQQSTESPGVTCVPATIHLAGAEIELVSLVAREQRLRTAIETYLASTPTPPDFVLIDCPPSLGLLTVNAFVAAKEVLIPIQCEYYALEGLSQLIKSIEMIKKHLNPSLELSTILLTMYDSRTKLASQVADEVKLHFPNQVLSTIIPRSVRVSEAPSYGRTVISYDRTSPGAIAYLEAAIEMANRGAARG